MAADLEHIGMERCNVLFPFVASISPDGSPSPSDFKPASAFVVASTADDCWKLAGECERWAEEVQESATGLAFRQLAKVWAQLAFGRHFKPQAENDGAPPGIPKTASQSGSLWQRSLSFARFQELLHPFRALGGTGHCPGLNDAFTGPVAIICMRVWLAKSEASTRHALYGPGRCDDVCGPVASSGFVLSIK